MAPRLTSSAWALIKRQRGIIACWQGPDVGIPTRRLRSAADSDQQWSWAGKRTLVFGDSDLSADQLRVVGCLEAGPQAMLSGLSGLQEAGWPHEDDGYVHVLMPRNSPAAVRGMPWTTRLHYGEAPEAVHGAVRRTTTVRALVDAVAWARTDREAEFLITSSMQQGLVAASDILSSLAERRFLKRTALIRELVAEFNAGSHSMGELDFIRECRRRGLPEPERQVARLDASGRARFVDVEFRRPDGGIVMVEIDGVGHMSAQEWRADMERHNDLAIATGALVLRVTAWEVRHDPDPFFRRLARALA